MAFLVLEYLMLVSLGAWFCGCPGTGFSFCSPVKKTPNAQFDTSVQLLQSQPPMQMSDCPRSTQQQPAWNHLSCLV
jgi:hypothetical protein